MILKKQDFLFLVILAALAAFIWLRDLSWVSTSDDTLPILIALPLFAWIDWPWKMKKGEFSLSSPHCFAGFLLLLVGVVTNLTVFLGLAWALLLWSWLTKRIDREQHPHMLKLMILPLMAFPWVTLDAYEVGWWFRLSGAWSAASIFGSLGMDVIHEGTHLVVNGLPISVDVSCAGLNALQSMLIAGSALAYIQLGDSPRFWINIPFLLVMAWVANTMRIMMIAVAAIAISPEFAMGPFHETGGWLLLSLMFVLCWIVFSLQQEKAPTQRAGT